MTTKSPFTGSSEGKMPCSASVEYKSRRGPCKREGKHPDPDGVLWWCGLHDPRAQKRREQAKAAKATEVVVAEVVVDITTKTDSVSVPVGDLVVALKDAHSALCGLSNMRDSGWPDNTPVDNYKIVLSALNQDARNAAEKVGEVVKLLNL